MSAVSVMVVVAMGARLTAGNRQYTTLKSTPRISLFLFGTEQVPPEAEPD